MVNDMKSNTYDNGSGNTANRIQPLTTGRENFSPADHLEAWRFNVALECSGASLCAIESIAVGGAVLTMASLLEALEWASTEIDRLNTQVSV